MPKRNTEEYENDGGFVEDAPKAKSDRSNKKQKRPTPNAKSAGDESVPGGGQSSPDGEYWELSAKRRVQISEFKGKHMVNIREYYEKDGEMLPGKKGISLTLEQFDTVVSLLPHIESVLREKGHVLKRPDFDGTAVEADGGLEGEDGDVKDEMSEDEIKKKNFDDTSEDE